MNMEDYDVVIDVLSKHKDILQKMIDQNSLSDIGFGIMDQIRYDQINKIDECIDMWNKHKPKQTIKDFYETSTVGR